MGYICSSKVLTLLTVSKNKITVGYSYGITSEPYFFLIIYLIYLIFITFLEQKRAKLEQKAIAWQLRK